MFQRFQHALGINHCEGIILIVRPHTISSTNDSHRRVVRTIVIRYLMRKFGVERNGSRWFLSQLYPLGDVAQNEKHEEPETRNKTFETFGCTATLTTRSDASFKRLRALFTFFFLSFFFPVSLRPAATISVVHSVTTERSHRGKHSIAMT